MELKKLDTVTAANEGFTLTIYDPKTNVDTDISVTVLGRDSDKFRKLQSELQRRRMSKATRGGLFKASMISSEEIEQDTMEILVACTLSWENVTINGDALPCTPENVRRVFTEYPWLKEQVDTGVNDRANFLPQS